MSDSPLRTPPEEEWENLMRQLRDQPAAQPRPFFYNRVNARLSGRAANPGRALPLWVLRPAYAALLGVIMLALSGDARALHPGPDATPATAADSEPPLAPLPR
jgi:hypothetical protein